MPRVFWGLAAKKGVLCVCFKMGRIIVEITPSPSIIRGAYSIPWEFLYDAKPSNPDVSRASQVVIKNILAV